MLVGFWKVLRIAGAAFLIALAMAGAHRGVGGRVEAASCPSGGILVNTTADSIPVNPLTSPLDSNGKVSLRSAVVFANSETNNVPHTICLAAATYVLTLGPADNELVFNNGGASSISGDIDIFRRDITILGVSSAQTIVDANGLDRVFDVNNFEKNPKLTPINATFQDLTIQGGDASKGGPDAFGGGIQFNGYTTTAQPGNKVLTLTNVVVRNNKATNNGGGIYVQGGATLFLNNSQVLNNTGKSGGGVFLIDGDLESNNSLINSNIAQGDSNGGGSGGGLVMMSGTTGKISGGQISTNQAKGALGATCIGISCGIGGGAVLFGGPFIISNGVVQPDSLVLQDNVIIDGNQAVLDGGGLYVHPEDSTGLSTGAIGLYSATVTNNTAFFGNGGGINVERGLLTTARGSVQAGNLPALDEIGPVTISRNHAVNGGGVYESLANVTSGGQTLVNLGVSSLQATFGTSNRFPVLIADNTATQNGGGVAVVNPSQAGPANTPEPHNVQLSIVVANITGNKADSDGDGDGDGGAIYLGDFVSDPADNAHHAFLTMGSVRVFNNSAPHFDVAGTQAPVTDSIGIPYLDTTDNWWGCNTGPNTTGCARVSSNALSSGFSIGHSGYYWQTLLLSASPTTLGPSGSTVTGTFAFSDTEEGLSLNFDELDGLPIQWGTVSATLVSQETTVQTNGSAKALVVPVSGCTTATVGAFFDNAQPNIDLPCTATGGVPGGPKGSGPPPGAAPSAPPRLVMNFPPAGKSLFAVGMTTSLSFMISNSNISTRLTGIGFSVTLPEGFVLTPEGAEGTCGAGSAISAGGSPLTITLSNGSLAPGTSCNLRVALRATTQGFKKSTTSAVTSNEAGAGNTASAIVVVSP